MSRLREILQRVDNIPPFPKVAQRVMGMLQDPEVSTQALAKVIELDQVITANVLRLCNSALMGLPRKVSSLGEALVVLGQTSLREVIIASSSSRFFKAKTSGYDLAQGELWLHSVAVATMARQLVRYIPGVEAGTAFTSGLLHDIGKICLSNFVGEEFRAIMLKVVQEKCPFVTAEMAVLGINHAELGAKILEKWEFPEEVIVAVRLHHDPEVFTADPLSALVALSNALTVSAGIGVGVDGLITRLRGEGLARFGITQETLDRCMAELVDRIEQIKELLLLA